jgi:hypothetical protein
VVSAGAQTPELLGFQNPETTPPSIPTTPRTAPTTSGMPQCLSQATHHGGEDDKIDWIARSKLSRIIGLVI